MLSRAPRLALFALLAAFGCSSTDTSSAGGGSSPSSFPTIKITSPAEGACVEVPTDRAAGVPISITTTVIALRPPGDCAQLDPCGHVELQVNGAPNNSGASLVIDALSTPDNPFSGTVEVTATLVKDSSSSTGGTGGSSTTSSDSAVLGADKKPVTAKVSFIAKASCSGGSGGSGGSTGGSGGSTGGSGGSTGGSTTTGSGGSGGSGGATTTGSGGSAGSGGATTTGSGGSGGSTGGGSSSGSGP